MKYADPLDRAQAETEQVIQHSLATRPVYQGKSSLYCHNCAEPIPQARREAVLGCSFCIDCQKLIDDQNKR